MKFRLIVIDEAINLEDSTAQRIWQKALWSKSKGYRKHYQLQFLPLSVDDFFATHFILAEELGSGEVEPISMFKSVRRDQAKKFNTPFGLYTMLGYAKNIDMNEIEPLVNQKSDVSYISSWSINPVYKENEEAVLMVRDLNALMALHGLSEMGVKRWFAGASCQFKVDKYLADLGARQIIPVFELPNFDNQSIRLMYQPSTDSLDNKYALKIKLMRSYWDNRIHYEPRHIDHEQKAS